MTIEVISQDRSVFALCREIGREISTITWNFIQSGESSSASSADLYLCEHKPGHSVPADAPWGTRYFVLLNPKDVPDFRASHPWAAPGIILKPVTRAVLRAIVIQRVSAARDEAQLDAKPLRSDRDELLEGLIQANLKLQEFEAERSSFLGRALHDFHAPLTALNGYCSLLLQDKTGALNEEHKSMLSRMQRSVRRLSRMSAAMFQLSAGRNVRVKPLLREVEISECVQQAMSEVQQLAAEKRLQIEVNVEPALLFIDSGQIEQVMLNLLENACKFSPRRGSILVSGYPCFCERRASNVFFHQTGERRRQQGKPANVYRINVLDSGPGIPPDHLKSIFEEYVSYASGPNRSRAGLGLAICRMIVHQHCGRIWAETTESGCLFSFVIPLQRATAAADSSEAVASPASLETCA